MIFVQIHFTDLKVGDVIATNERKVYQVRGPGVGTENEGIYCMSVAPRDGDFALGPPEDLYFSETWCPFLVATEEQVAPRVLESLHKFNPDVRKVVYKYIRDHICSTCFDINCMEHIL